MRSTRPPSAKQGDPAVGAARPASARERVLDAASRLFARDGYRAVGIDTIIAEAGVAKMSLYSHFPSKDHLIIAYLERANEYFWRWLEGAAAGADGPEAKLVAIFDATAELATSPECPGCSFQSAAAEFPEYDHPGHKIAVEHKRAVRRRLRGLAAEAGLRDPDALADQLLLLMDGAFVGARMFGTAGTAAARTGAAARALVAAARG